MKYQKPFASTQALRDQIRTHYLADEEIVVEALMQAHRCQDIDNNDVQISARDLVEKLRSVKNSSSLIDRFLQEFSLSSEEGVVLMCLAEALLRIPDAQTVDALIRDKIGSGNWAAHLGKSSSIMVNASTWGMMLTGKWISVPEKTRQNPLAFLRKLGIKSGEPAIRLAIRQAMKLMGQEFVLAETIHKGLEKSKRQVAKGFSYSYDMLGEGARTQTDAANYINAYSQAISALAQKAKSDNPIINPGISVKLSALHSRYEFGQTARVESELYDTLFKLATQAKHAKLGFNIDAEEADRLESSLSLFERLAHEPTLADWDGLGFVVQTYQKRALSVINWLADLAKRSQHKFMVRLVKGAYWDTEIKHAQVLGHQDYPVFTRKENTDLNYLVCAQTMLENKSAFYPQFATHNARTVAAIMAYASKNSIFEFQCLHGMGEALYETVVADGFRCRIYAPIGEHKRLLAYLVRRLLENGANTSFVNMLADKEQDIETIIANPIDKITTHTQHRHPSIPLPAHLFSPSRLNSKGTNTADSDWLDAYYPYLECSEKTRYTARPLLGKKTHTAGEKLDVFNPATGNCIGNVENATASDVETAIKVAHQSYPSWDELGAEARALMLEEAANLYEKHNFELLSLCQLEAGKTLVDAVSELREAIDFMRYYAGEARSNFRSATTLPGPTGETNEYKFHARGVFVCISPWNFPLAIFTGQLSAALLAGNAVLVKPAEQTPLIAARAVELLHQAGVPRKILQYLPGSGHTIGHLLTSHTHVDGVVFTGGTKTARNIHSTMSARPNTPLPHLIAETGGLNAMIVDSSALLEQVVIDVIASAFQSAGQRCSALRVLVIQDDIAEDLINMIKGAMDELIIGDPTYLKTDIGPIIDSPALAALEAHIKLFEKNVIWRSTSSTHSQGYFCVPTLIEIEGIEVLKNEVFGPILHIVRYSSANLDKIISAINNTGFGLTLGVHSRINETVERIINRAQVGNIYVNRNIIGAVVGSQPFGGQGLSGTGPKAGGPNYLQRFAVERVISTDTTAAGGNASLLTLV